MHAVAYNTWIRCGHAGSVHFPLSLLCFRDLFRWGYAMSWRVEQRERISSGGKYCSLFQRTDIYHVNRPITMKWKITQTNLPGKKNMQMNKHQGVFIKIDEDGKKKQYYSKKQALMHGYTEDTGQSLHCEFVCLLVCELSLPKHLRMLQLHNPAGAL